MYIFVFNIKYVFGNPNLKYQFGYYYIRDILVLYVKVCTTNYEYFLSLKNFSRTPVDTLLQVRIH